ncbi:hypothetical protein [Streptomyces sp. NPDC018610]|uniref:hypothetical protein n=1 Tax=Streptomyces sp. NPDC018610 TaxID=3365049 RepID=UPI0037B43286
MHMFLVALAVSAVALMAVSGVLGVTTGWVPRPARRRIARPRLWGYGQLIGAAGAALWLFLGVLPARFDVLPLVGWCVFMASLGVQTLARRPAARIHRPAPADSAS